MNENVTKFFELYAQDAGLRARVSEAEASYPGSLELREPLAELEIRSSTPDYVREAVLPNTTASRT